MSEDIVKQVDVIVLLNGAFPRSVLETARLFHQKVSNKIILTKERDLDNLDDLRRAGAMFPSTHEIQSKALIDLGVPKENIHLLNVVCNKTEDEALAIKEHLSNQKDVQSILLVTRRTHTRRAKIIFSKTLGPSYNVFAKAYPKDPVSPSHWHEDAWHMYEVVMEALKFIYLYIPLTNTK